jgi:lysosomal acid lipase/cholesteryl ester hydrolase
MSFWNFTFEEMGTKDIPAILEHIFNLRNSESSNINQELHSSYNNKITYIGHSQGTAQIFVAISKNQDYFNKYLNGVIALGPISKIKHFSSFILKQFSNNKIEKVFDIFKIKEVFTTKHPVNNINKIMCDIIPSICEEALEMISDKSIKNNDSDKFLVWASHYPSGTSSKNIAHFSKILRDKQFEDFNGVPYDLTKITKIPIAMFVGKDDKLSTVEDSRELRNLLIKSGALIFYKEYDKFGHSTFFLNKDNEYINDVKWVLNTVKYK